MTKSLIILSGGIDSTTLLWKLKATHPGKVAALSFDYGQKHTKELQSARRLCEGAGVPWHLADISAIKPLISKGALSGPDPVPEGHYTNETMRATIVPNRNMIMLSIAIGHAVANNIPEVYYAAHAGDHDIYPDCRPEFVELMDTISVIANDNGPRVVAPFIRVDKAFIVRLGATLGVPFSSTWSCYNGRERACGRCGTCVERLEAFHSAGIEDPLPYEDKTYWWTQVKGPVLGGGV